MTNVFNITGINTSHWRIALPQISEKHCVLISVVIFYNLREKLNIENVCFSRCDPSCLIEVLLQIVLSGCHFFLSIDSRNILVDENTTRIQSSLWTEILF